MEIACCNPDISQKAEDLINIIKTRFIRRDGLLARNYPPRERTLFDNFDDIVPYFIFFGETEFLLSQVRIIHEKRESMLSLCTQDGVLVTRNIDEWFGGLYALWKETADEVTYNLLRESVDFVLENLVRDDFLSAAFYPNNRKCAAFYECWSSGLLETFCEMREDFPRCFEQGQKVLRAWVSDKYFREHALFPYRVYMSAIKRFMQETFLSKSLPRQSNSRPPAFVRGGKWRRARNMLKQCIFFVANNGLYSQLMKSNSTTAFALLEYHRATGDAFWLESLLEWIKSATENFCENGKVYMELVPKTRLKRNAGARPSFILTDVLCDTAYFAGDIAAQCKDGFLSTAKEILDYGWNNRLEFGLIPHVDGGDFAHIDDQVDFAVSLRRYSDVAGEHSYRTKSVELTTKALEIHYSPNGYFTYSGKKTNNVIDPKYNALLLKAFANLITIDEPLYPAHHSLFKDR